MIPASFLLSAVFTYSAVWPPHLEVSDPPLLVIVTTTNRKSLQGKSSIGTVQSHLLLRLSFRFEIPVLGLLGDK